MNWGNAARGLDVGHSSPGPVLSVVPPLPARHGWDALDLQQHLARLPPSQPCLACRSHDEDDELVVIAPQLEKVDHDGTEEYSAVFACSLCGAVNRAPLRP